MAKNIWSTAIMITSCLILADIAMAVNAEDAKNVEIVEAEINIDHHELPPVAYLDITVTNKGDKKLSNLTLEISYYGAGNSLVHRSVIKDPLNALIPPGETKEYSIRLRGDFFNIKNEQYPYSSQEKIEDFDLKMLGVKWK